MLTPISRIARVRRKRGSRVDKSQRVHLPPTILIHLLRRQRVVPIVPPKLAGVDGALVPERVGLLGGVAGEVPARGVSAPAARVVGAHALGVGPADEAPEARGGLPAVPAPEVPPLGVARRPRLVALDHLVRPVPLRAPQRRPRREVRVVERRRRAPRRRRERPLEGRRREGDRGQVRGVAAPPLEGRDLDRVVVVFFFFYFFVGVAFFFLDGGRCVVVVFGALAGLSLDDEGIW